MSCGTPHEMDCAEVLTDADQFLDDSTDERDRTRINRHLDECPPCLHEYDMRTYHLQREVRIMLTRSCACPQAPERLRVQIITRIQGTGACHLEGDAS